MINIAVKAVVAVPIISTIKLDKIDPLQRKLEILLRYILF